MNEATLQFVRQHVNDDVRQLALRGSKDPEVDLQRALQQIAGRQTACKKLPSWAEHEEILFPPHLSMEQCSSEQTARYKQSVCRALIENPEALTDLTGGFGVDFSFLAPLFQKSTYVEQQGHLCELARHNFNILGLHSEVVCANSTDYLQTMPKVSILFLDPARRNEHGGRTYDISDCTPDVLSLRDQLLQKADFVVLKLSPMLDWRKAVNDLGTQWVKEVHIVSTGGECKELLIVLSKEESKKQRLVCVNDSECFETETNAVQTIPPTAEAVVGAYLYEPNASIMKAGCFGEVSAQFGMAQVAPNSHLFVSDTQIKDFPGRKFRVVDVSSLNKKELKEKILPLGKANITVRNFPLTVAELRKRLKLSDGGNRYIFATTLANGNRVLIACEQLF